VDIISEDTWYKVGWWTSKQSVAKFSEHYYDSNRDVSYLLYGFGDCQHHELDCHVGHRRPGSARLGPARFCWEAVLETRTIWEQVPGRGDRTVGIQRHVSFKSRDVLFGEVHVGNTIEHTPDRAQGPPYLNAFIIANIIFEKIKVPRFQCDKTYCVHRLLRDMFRLGIYLGNSLVLRRDQYLKQERNSH